MKVIDFTDIDVKYIIHQYTSGRSINAIARHYDCSPATCKKILTRNNIDIRTVSQANILNGKNIRTYKLNEDFFANIDCELKAYWLGFLMADGNVNKNSNTINLSLQRKDKKHLQKFLQHIDANYNVVDYINSNNSKQSRIAITSYTMKQDLNKYGIVPNKSLIAEPCDFNDINLNKAFWRGYIDGDGSICYRIRSNDNIEWTLNLLGTYSMLTAFSTFIYNNLNIKQRTLFKDGKIHALSTVQMAYEGLDVPEITHIACLTDIRSRPWIEQMVARATRYNKKMEYNSQRAFVYTPDDIFMQKIQKQMNDDEASVINISTNNVDTSMMPSQAISVSPISSEMIGQRAFALDNDDDEVTYDESEAIMMALPQNMKDSGVSVLDIKRFLNNLGTTDIVLDTQKAKGSKIDTYGEQLTPREQENRLKSWLQKYCSRWDRENNKPEGTLNKILRKKFQKSRKDMELKELNAVKKFINNNYSLVGIK